MFLYWLLKREAQKLSNCYIKINDLILVWDGSGIWMHLQLRQSMVIWKCVICYWQILVLIRLLAIMLLLNWQQVMAISKLWDARVDPSGFNNYAVRIASKNGHFEVVKLLLSDAHVDPSDSLSFGFRLASDEGHLEIVKLLLADARVDPSAENNFAVRMATENGHLETVKLLLTDARVDSKGSNDGHLKINVEVWVLIIELSFCWALIYWSECYRRNSVKNMILFSLPASLLCGVVYRIGT
jgi:hypothetical protein